MLLRSKNIQEYTSTGLVLCFKGSYITLTHLQNIHVCSAGIRPMVMLTWAFFSPNRHCHYRQGLGMPKTSLMLKKHEVVNLGAKYKNDTTQLHNHSKPAELCVTLITAQFTAFILINPLNWSLMPSKWTKCMENMLSWSGMSND